MTQVHLDDADAGLRGGSRQDVRKERPRFQSVWALLRTVRPRIPVVLVGLGVLLVAAGAFVTSRVLEHERVQAVAAAEKDALSLARAYEEHIHQVVRRLDLALTHLRDEYEREPASLTGKASWTSPIHADLAFQVLAIDADGRLAASSLPAAATAVDFSDRDYFRFHRNGDRDVLHISKPLVGRISNRQTIQFTRRLHGLDGAFAGVMALSLDPERLAGYYGPDEIGKTGSVMLLGTDGVVRARSPLGSVSAPAIGSVHPGAPFLQPSQPASGVFHTTGGTDGLRSLVAYRRLKDAPLVVLISLGEEEAMAEFEALRAAVVEAQSVVSFVVLGTVLLLAWLIQSQTNQQRRLTAAQALLAQTEERWRLALESIGDGVWDWNPQTGDVFYSARWKDMLGPAGNEVGAGIGAGDEVGGRVAERGRHIHADDREAVRTALEQHFAGRTPFYSSEHRVLCKDGHYKWILDRGIVVSRGPEGEPMRVIGTHTDITVRKQTEQALGSTAARLTAILDSVPVGIIIVDAQRRIMVANSRMAQMVLRTVDGLVGSTSRLLYSSEEQFQDLGRHLYPSLQRGETVGDDLQMYRSDGTMFWARIVGRRVSMDDPSLGIVWVVDDITDRRGAQEALVRQTAELRRSNAELEAFAYVASHDLRQPLRTINSYLALLEKDLDGVLDTDTREYIAFVRSGAQRMDRLIVDLLEYSRVGRRTRPMEERPATDIIGTAIRNLEVAIAEASATVTMDDDLPTLRGDEDELVRLFQNIIGNAVKYRAHDRDPVVHVACEAEDEAWHFRIRDNGIGIAPENAERVFGIFQRLHGRDEYEGTGVGLAVCKKIVEHHGGHIRVESALDQGSVFHVTLPRREAPGA